MRLIEGFGKRIQIAGRLGIRTNDKPAVGEMAAKVIISSQ